LTLAEIFKKELCGQFLGVAQLPGFAVAPGY
jgi:hypothetical protein